MLLALMFASALAGAEPTQGATAAPQRVPVSAPLKPGERRVKMVCRNEQKANSRVSVRNCYDQAELAAREAADQKMLQEIQMKSPLN
ncbi:hypothetical protein [Phenylobacterium sp.]|uniref:hypothetical protein n=1 Tax=Phenylobacterium sp. TaxID=1871053 RepID=UPI00286DA1EE|nr:hypothetical protein [Phenylobacterium sp.]